MSKAWGLLAVVVALAACGNKKESNKTPIVREEEIPPPAQPEMRKVVVVDDNPSIDDQLMNGSTPTTPVKAECVDDAAVVSYDPAKLRACFDANGDGEADRCVTWRRDGKVASIDSEFAVEDADAETPREPAIEYRSDDENNDDDRITLDGSNVEICPYDRTCLKIMPKLAESELQRVLTDPDYKRAVFVVRDFEGGKGSLEIWDLATGRLRTRAAMKRLVADETYDFTAHLGSGVVIGIADDSSGRALGTIFGLDGSFRGELAQGSRNLDIEKTFRHAGVFGIADIGPVDTDDKPYVVYFHNLASGAAAGKLSIQRDDDGDDDLAFHTLPNGFVAIKQFGEQMRIDMFDLRTRTNRVLFAPGC
jgi:hypothetical protein